LIRSPWFRFISSSLRLSMATALLLGFVTLSSSNEQDPQDPKKDPAKEKKEQAKIKLGLNLNDAKAFQGYTLIASLNSNKTYLIDMEGKVVRTWNSPNNPAASAYFLENGNLLRTGSLRGKDVTLNGAAAGGQIQEISWDGEVVWDFKFTSENHLPHHDICRMPNGNILMVVWDRKTAKEATDAGRRPDSIGDGNLLADCIMEVKPTGKTTGEIVWKWHAWDHLIQDHDKTKANYGKISEHPELIDVNFGSRTLAKMMTKKDDLDKLRGIGYLGAAPKGKDGKAGNPSADWTHINAIAYNAELDQIMVSIHSFSEIWIIDHSTTKEEAASHKGGRYGKGGDLLYRWGNPRAYRRGSNTDQKLFSQHNAHWIPKGLPGEGNVIIFNNGGSRPGGASSSVDEIVLPMDSKGNFTLEEGATYGPDKPVWSYSAPKKSDFYSSFISGAHRLPNGNTFICSGANGTVFEVTPDKEIVWKYVNPTRGGFGGPGGGGVVTFGGPPTVGEILPVFLQDTIQMKAEQKKELAEFQKTITPKVDKLLTEEQQKKLKDPSAFMNLNFGKDGPPRSGEILPKFQQELVKLTDEQKKSLADIQKEVDEKLEKLLTDEQKKQLKEMRDGFARMTVPKDGQPKDGAPKGVITAKGPAGLGGPPGGNALFRAYKYGPKFPGLVGKDLSSTKTIEEIQAEEDKKAKEAKAKEPKAKEFTDKEAKSPPKDKKD
jgi:hypothetical protein